MRTSENPPPFPGPKHRGGRSWWSEDTNPTAHITEQLLAFFFLKVDESSSERLGRWRRRLDRRRLGLDLAIG